MKYWRIFALLKSSFLHHKQTPFPHSPHCVEIIIWRHIIFIIAGQTQLIPITLVDKVPELLWAERLKERTEIRVHFQPKWLNHTEYTMLTLGLTLPSANLALSKQFSCLIPVADNGSEQHWRLGCPFSPAWGYTQNSTSNVFSCYYNAVHVTMQAVKHCFPPHAFFLPPTSSAPYSVSCYAKAQCIRRFLSLQVCLNKSHLKTTETRKTI